MQLCYARPDQLWNMTQSLVRLCCCSAVWSESMLHLPDQWCKYDPQPWSCCAAVALFGPDYATSDLTIRVNTTPTLVLLCCCCAVWIWLCYVRPDHQCKYDPPPWSCCAAVALFWLDCYVSPDHRCKYDPHPPTSLLCCWVLVCFITFKRLCFYRVIIMSYIGNFSRWEILVKNDAWKLC